ncbi:SDR family NAD(P)-dependent oxidoreductase [Flagellimonas pacifica]|uniref:Nucleoside-diphosphate-sugar epimerase n=1 Tax=Flagellimonas pacifica TaxID=1247520 RepID=A0A285MBR1_9FLAO|nr:SDR family NAD(P)-dependent oxidoreductase [Allomuricauda parva]SNY94614.1 Nucleoside-diphosphate-sugar epimerase [Allomuricauda parva]
MILVTGGTGLIGSHLLFHLVKSGKSVKASYRNKDTIHKVSKVFGYYSDTPSDFIDKITWIQADISDIEALRGLFTDIEYVYHCAALISFDPKDYARLVKINIEGTANVVNLCLEHHIKKLCYISSIAAIGSSLKDKETTEENEWNDSNVSVYGLTKHDAELEVWRGSQEGLSVVVVNPGVVLGPGFWNSGSGTFFRHASKGKKSFIPGGTGFVTIHDVINAMTLLMESQIVRERFILVNENLTYQQIFQKIAISLGVEPPRKKIPFWMLECLWRTDWLRSKLRGKRRRLTKSMVKGLYHQEMYNTDKIKKAISFEFGDLNAMIDFCSEKFRN